MNIQELIDELEKIKKDWNLHRTDNWEDIEIGFYNDETEEWFELDDKSTEKFIDNGIEINTMNCGCISSITLNLRKDTEN